MRVLVAPDSFGGTLSSREVAEAVASGWRRSRPGDELTILPLADGGEGLLDVVASEGDRWHTAEVAGPLGTPVEARFLLKADGLAVVESATACGLALLGEGPGDPLRTTTYGVGQLLTAARKAGAGAVVVGTGGSATVDGGAGALLALGFQITRADGNGVKVGGGELRDVAAARPRWVDPAWRDVEVEVWCDVRTPLLEAVRLYGPQKGAGGGDLERLEVALTRWAEVAERDLAPPAGVGQAPGRPRDRRGTGAAGGLAFGLLVGLGARLVDGARRVAAQVGLDDALEAADLVVTGEGRLDRTSLEGKVVGYVAGRAADRHLPVLAVVGRSDGPVGSLTDLEAAVRDDAPDPASAGAVAEAAERLAGRV